MAAHQTETWDLWYPKGGATGIPFARGRVDAGVMTLLVHAAPEYLTATVYGPDGKPQAAGEDLAVTTDSPICRLTRRGDRIEREDIWPTDADLGRLVLLPGGEVGTLKSWWHADDHTEWRWQIELYNHK